MRYFSIILAAALSRHPAAAQSSSFTSCDASDVGMTCCYISGSTSGLGTCVATKVAPIRLDISL